MVPESSIYPELVDLFDKCEAEGATFPTFLERLAGEVRGAAPLPGSDLEPMRMDDAPALGEDLFRITEVEMLMLTQDSPCANNLKVGEAFAHACHLAAGKGNEQSDHSCVLCPTVVCRTFLPTIAAMCGRHSRPESHAEAIGRTSAGS